MFADKLIVLLAIIIVVLAVAIMVVMGSESLKRWFGMKLMAFAKKLEEFTYKWFSDDEYFDAEWMDEEAWKKTRL
jgi:hypothetical protein